MQLIKEYKDIQLLTDNKGHYFITVQNKEIYKTSHLVLAIRKMHLTIRTV